MRRILILLAALWCLTVTALAASATDAAIDQLYPLPIRPGLMPKMVAEAFPKEGEAAMGPMEAADGSDTVWVANLAGGGVLSLHTLPGGEVNLVMVMANEPAQAATAAVNALRALGIPTTDPATREAVMRRAAEMAAAEGSATCRLYNAANDMWLYLRKESRGERVVFDFGTTKIQENGEFTEKLGSLEDLVIPVPKK